MSQNFHLLNLVLAVLLIISCLGWISITHFSAVCLFYFFKSSEFRQSEKILVHFSSSTF